MIIELKNAKVSSRLSEDSQAFSADVWVDGVKRGTVRNHGNGGPNEVSPPALRLEIEAHARTLPEIPLPWDKSKTMPTCADILIGEALGRAVEGKRLARLLKTHTVLVRDGKAYTVKGKPAALKPGSEVLNGLPFEAALTRWLATAT